MQKSRNHILKSYACCLAICLNFFFVRCNISRKSNVKLNHQKLSKSHKKNIKTTLLISNKKRNNYKNITYFFVGGGIFLLEKLGPLMLVLQFFSEGILKTFGQCQGIKNANNFIPSQKLILNKYWEYSLPMETIFSICQNDDINNYQVTANMLYQNSLPSGITFDDKNYKLYGNPRELGVKDIIIKAQDFYNNHNFAQSKITLVTEKNLTIWDYIPQYWLFFIGLFIGLVLFCCLKSLCKACKKRKCCNNCLICCCQCCYCSPCCRNYLNKKSVKKKDIETALAETPSRKESYQDSSDNTDGTE